MGADAVFTETCDPVAAGYFLLHDAHEALLGDVPLAGFYSYGEICPHPVTRKCDLHNQTMTITLLGEQA